MFVFWKAFDWSPFSLPVNDWMNTQVAKGSVAAHNVAGFESELIQQRPATDRLINLVAVNGIPRVHIENGCNGLTLLALFAGFILAYPGSWKKKAWFIPLGLVIVYLVNLGRVMLLTYNHVRYNESFDFNHKYTFLIAVYACIFGLWMVWINKLSDFSASDLSAKNKPTNMANEPEIMSGAS